MRFLIPIKDDSVSTKNKLKTICPIVSGYKADVSLLYVGVKMRGIHSGGMKLAHQTLEDWNILHPGLEVLEWAFDFLKSEGYIANSNLHFGPEDLVEKDGRIHVSLQLTNERRMRLILREGNLFSEVKKETDNTHYDMTVLGRPRSDRTLHKMIQFLNSSVFIMNKVNPEKHYKILLLVDDSHGSKKAIMMGREIAEHFDADLRLLTVSKRKTFGHGYLGASRWAQRFMNRHQKKHSVSMLVGDPVQVFAQEAGDDHIIVMGNSGGNELVKLFRGSKPIQTAKLTSTPIIVVK